MKKVIYIPLCLILGFSSCKKLGCTDPNANNYNSAANQDNGNCTYTLMDIEGNSYGAKTIGHQIWMTENLKVKKYRNGDTIPQVQDALQWSQLTTGAGVIIKMTHLKEYGIIGLLLTTQEGWHQAVTTYQQMQNGRC